MDKIRFTKLVSISLALLCVLGSSAWAGTVAPDVPTLPSDSAVEMLVQYSGSVPASACGPAIATKIALCTLTSAAAATLAQTAGVTHISVNHALKGTAESVTPVYDYLPESLFVNPLLSALAGIPDFLA